MIYFYPVPPSDSLLLILPPALRSSRHRRHTGVSGSPGRIARPITVAHGTRAGNTGDGWWRAAAGGPAAVRLRTVLHAEVWRFGALCFVVLDLFVFLTPVGCENVEVAGYFWWGLITFRYALARQHGHVLLTHPLFLLRPTEHQHQT